MGIFKKTKTNNGGVSGLKAEGESFTTRESAAAILDDSISSLPGVERKESRWGLETAYFVEGKEFAHFHAENEIDVRLTKTLQKKLRRRLSTDPRVKFRPRPSEWVVIILSARKDADFAFELIQLAREANVARTGILPRR